MTFASYGLVPGLLLVWYVVTALLTSARGVLLRSEDRIFYCLAVLVALLCIVQFLGSSTSFTDWLAVVCLSTAIRIFSLDERTGRVHSSGRGYIVRGAETLHVAHPLLRPCRRRRSE